MINSCPKCNSKDITKAGIIDDRQRYKCKECNYHFTVAKSGKSTDIQIVKRALQLYLEGLSYREIESLLEVSHVSVMNWVKKYKIQRPSGQSHQIDRHVLAHDDVIKLIEDREFLHDTNVLISRINGHYMVLTFGPQSKDFVESL